MSQYVYAPVGTFKEISSDILFRRCISYIGSLQPKSDFSSSYSRGLRYLKHTIGCSTKAIKRSTKRHNKYFKHDFKKHDEKVFYYHIDHCADIVDYIITFMMDKCDKSSKEALFKMLVGKEEYLNHIYYDRFSMLEWVADQNYKGQQKDATKIIDKLNTLRGRQ